MAQLPIEEADTLDYIVLDTTQSPGVCVLSGHDRWKNWDDQKAKGTVGATSVLNGDDIGTFQAEFFLSGDSLDEQGRSDFARWDSFRKLIESTTNGPKPVALPVYHPDLAKSKFSEIVGAGIGAPKYDGLGGKSYVCKFQEFKPPKPKPIVKASGGTPKVRGGSRGGPEPKPDPNAAAKQQLAGLLKQAQTP